MSDETPSQETWAHIWFNPKFGHVTHWAHPHIHCVGSWGYFIYISNNSQAPVWAQISSGEAGLETCSLAPHHQPLLFHMLDDE